MGTAGGSARAEYERRRGREQEQNRRTAGVGAVLVAAFSGVTLVAVFAGLRSIAPGLPSWQHLAAAGFVAFAVAVWTATELWGRRQSTEAWDAGARGEEATARLLAPLEQQEAVVLHDRRIPRSRANIDHIVVTPQGVVVIDSKRYTRGVEIRRDGLYSSGRRLDKVVEGAQRQQRLVAEAVGPAVPVRVLLCFHGGQVDRASRRLPWAVDGVGVCSGRRLVERLGEWPADAPTISVADVAATIGGTFPPAVG